MSLRQRNGKWHYRFKISGHTWTGETGLVAIQRNRRAAQDVESAAWLAAKLGKTESLRIEPIKFSEAAEKFLTFVAGHHDKKNTVRRCKPALRRSAFTSPGNQWPRSLPAM
ncbi:MAG TPA: hypothetical protein VHZ55_27295 [Bryobacteraceae bacterium]|jgi:hypothetical protein|nr:hypothetical protein [Bryobacteraceae bacterium]